MKTTGRKDVIEAVVVAALSAVAVKVVDALAEYWERKRKKVK